MSDNDIGSLIGIVAAIALITYVIIYVRWSFGYKTSVNCPSCGTHNKLADFTCSNCHRKGGIKAEVIVDRFVKSVFFTCRFCKASAIHSMKCQQCGTDLHSLFAY